MLSPLPRRSGWAYSSLCFTQPYQPSPKGLSGRPAHCPFRRLLSVHSRYGLHTRAVTNSRHANRRLQPLRYLHDCSDCFRLERLPGGACTHWKAPPFHGARHKRPFHDHSFGEPENNQPIADDQSMLRRLFPLRSDCASTFHKAKHSSEPSSLIRRNTQSPSFARCANAFRNWLRVIWTYETKPLILLGRRFDLKTKTQSKLLRLLGFWYRSWLRGPATNFIYSLQLKGLGLAEAAGHLKNDRQPLPVRSEQRKTENAPEAKRRRRRGGRSAHRQMAGPNTPHRTECPHCESCSPQTCGHLRHGGYQTFLWVLVKQTLGPISIGTFTDCESADPHALQDFWKANWSESLQTRARHRDVRSDVGLRRDA